MESNQIVEHLSKVHLVSEGLCMSVERQLSEYHPLYAIMKYHCRGVFLANTLGAPVLLDPNEELDNLFPYGAIGANELVKKISKSYDWSDLNFENNIKVIYQRNIKNIQRFESVKTNKTIYGDFISDPMILISPVIGIYL
jgi:hypothetical protein